MSAHRGEEGLATIETTFMIVILVPLLAAHAARFAGELGGDDTTLRAYVARELTAVGIDPARVRVEVDPSRVMWRQPIRVSIRSDEPVDLPFVFSTTVSIGATAVARGELQR